jgi:hypothetical protein
VAKRAGTTHTMPVHGLRHTPITSLLRANVASEGRLGARWLFERRVPHSTGTATVIPSLQEDAALRIDAALRKTLAG